MDEQKPEDASEGGIGQSASTAGLGGDADLLAEYTKERGIGAGGQTITLASLIDSHRSLIQELEQPRNEWRDELQRARKRVESMAMDATWIKIDTLRGMTLQDLANLLGEE